MKNFVSNPVGGFLATRIPIMNLKSTRIACGLPIQGRRQKFRNWILISKIVLFRRLFQGSTFPTLKNELRISSLTYNVTGYGSDDGPEPGGGLGRLGYGSRRADGQAAHCVPGKSSIKIIFSPIVKRKRYKRPRRTTAT